MIYFRKIYGICYHLTYDENLAQDLVQDIFHSLWRKRNHLEIKVSLENYLVRAAKLEVMNYYRTKTNRIKHLKKALIGFNEEDNTTEEKVLLNELEQELNLLIEKLPSKSKKVFCLSRFKGMSNKEIASTLNISEKGVEYHITKVISYLKRNLELNLH